MANMLVQQKVKDFGAWKKMYDSVAELRSSKGARSDQVFRDASDPNMVTIIIEWDSLDHAKAYGQSPELKEAMMKAGVEGPPSIAYLDAV
jgi:heme-degrading monooxygenase HmoA